VTLKPDETSRTNAKRDNGDDDGQNQETGFGAKFLHGNLQTHHAARCCNNAIGKAEPMTGGSRMYIGCKAPNIK
jgi:hypothetical protein